MCGCYKHYVSDSIKGSAACGGQTFTKVDGGYNVHSVWDIFVADPDMTADLTKAANDKSNLEAFDPTTQISKIDTFNTTISSLS